jgi:hypothetical protein
MSRLWMMLVTCSLSLLLLVPVSAQETGTATASLTVSEQLAVNGMIVIENAVMPEAGWVVIHAVVGGQMGPTVGIAPLQAGENQNVPVMIDTLGATPESMAVLHLDTGMAGMYEFDMMPDVDPPVLQDDQPVQTPFRLTAITAFAQMITNNTAIIGSVISDQSTWVALYSDNAGQPGDVLGSAPVPAGTTPAVVVPLNSEPTTEAIWAVLHLDDGTTGTFEFDGQNGLDAQVTVNAMVASAPIMTSEAPVVQTVLGVPLDSTTPPLFDIPPQEAMGDGVTSTLAVNSVSTLVPGWLEVHADSGGHPGKPLGMVNLEAGEFTGLSVPLNAQMVPLVPPLNLPPMVWPMLHIDDSQLGVYEYLMVPGADVPIVVNGSVLTYPVTIGAGGAEATAEAATGAEATAEAGTGAEATPQIEATAEMGGAEATPEATEGANG